jgi:acyl-CoA thioesterase YciA
MSFPHCPPRPSHDSEPVTLPADRAPELRMMTMPADLNPAGDVFGGWIMSQVDIAGSIAAHRFARGRVVTVAVNAFTFREPVSVGDLVSFYAQVIRVGHTSITVDVEVFAERDPSAPQVVKVTEATLTYVALDENGNKRPVSPDGGGH